MFYRLPTTNSKDCLMINLQVLSLCSYRNAEEDEDEEKEHRGHSTTYFVDNNAFSFFSILSLLLLLSLLLWSVVATVLGSLGKREGDQTTSLYISYPLSTTIIAHPVNQFCSEPLISSSASNKQPFLPHHHHHPTPWDRKIDTADITKPPPILLVLKL